MKIEKAIEILEAELNKGANTDLSTAINIAIQHMKSLQAAPVKWFRIMDNGEISSQTTQRGYGKKALCKVVIHAIKPEICPCCGLPKVRNE